MWKSYKRNPLSRNIRALKFASASRQAPLQLTVAHAIINEQDPDCTVLDGVSILTEVMWSHTAR